MSVERFMGVVLIFCINTLGTRGGVREDAMHLLAPSFTFSDSFKTHTLPISKFSMYYGIITDGPFIKVID